MGTVVATKSGKFQAFIRISGHDPIYKLFDSRDDAQAYIDDIEPRVRAKVAAVAGKTKRPRAPASGLATLLNEKLRDILSRHFESDRVTARESKSLPTILRHVGEVRLCEIDREWVKDYIERLRASKTRVGRQFAYATIAVHIRMMHGICRKRAEELRIECPSLPLTTRLLPKGWDVKRVRRLHPKEALALRERMQALGNEEWGRQWRILVDLAVETGARQQELIWACWNHVDLESQVWIIPAEHTKCDTERQVPLSPYAVELGRELKRMADPSSPRVFHALSSPANVSAYFRKMRVEAGITDFKFHDLRHEACARMVRERLLPETAIMEIVGHSDVEMLARYANLTIWEKVEMLNAAKEGRPPRMQPVYFMHGEEPRALPSISQVGVPRAPLALLAPAEVVDAVDACSSTERAPSVIGTTPRP